MKNKTHDDMVELNFQAIKPVKQLRKETEEKQHALQRKKQEPAKPIINGNREICPGHDQERF